MAYHEIDKLEIKRSEWMRGGDTSAENDGDTYLYSSDAKEAGEGYKCCLGFMCLDMGYTVTEIKDFRVPSSLDDLGGWDWIHDDVNLNFDEDKWLHKAMNTNDTVNIPDDEREAQLIKHFADKNIALTFVD